jgi:hypothetical protein
MIELSEYRQVLHLYGQVINCLAGFEPPDQRLVEAQSLALNLFEHAAAMYSLSQGVETEPLVGKEGLLVPYASLDVLSRAILEDYLTFFYVFIDPDTEDEFEFRYCVWRLRGLAMREKFVIDFPPEEIGGVNEQIEFLEEQIEIHDKLRARIHKTNRFKQMKPRQQKKVLDEGKWLFPPWVDIAKSAGLGERFACAAYAFLSDQGHSGGLSAQQMGALSLEERMERIQSALDFVKAVVARMMLSYVDKFPKAKTVLDSNPKATRLAAVYAGALSLVK